MEKKSTSSQNAPKQKLGSILAQGLVSQISRHSAVQQVENLKSHRVPRSIPVDLVDANPYQPRLVFDEEYIEELALSIEEEGLLSPINVRIAGERYELIAGECRLRAHKKLGKKYIDALVEVVDDFESALRSLFENIHRKDLSDFEKYHAITRMRTSFTQVNDLQRKLDISKSQLYRIMAFGALPESSLNMLKANPKMLGANAVDALKPVIKEVQAAGLDYESALNKALRDLANGKLAQAGLAKRIREDLLTKSASAPKASTPSEDIVIGERKVARVSTKKDRVIFELDRKTFSDDQLKELRALISNLAEQGAEPRE
ncbi:ParB/RepB/Spo0J family partition protein [Pseudomonas luteola]|uniref:ParB/RepB/Spo0J family partition protein n=1 Tax=Pseudomonas luteola TaxID=47886 RepID=A0ABS0MXZ8_PSELU|nr:ParB/RepB/Spo0J family partition protein [Pseudomonas luteola]MBH3441591.1 ParB/RepB/Spo0J family partition protein [Pseudomonas luteola]